LRDSDFRRLHLTLAALTDDHNKHDQSLTGGFTLKTRNPGHENLDPITLIP
jgi:hypothetical protein